MAGTEMEEPRKREEKGLRSPFRKKERRQCTPSVKGANKP
jgi:hypothetical protein